MLFIVLFFLKLLTTALEKKFFIIVRCSHRMLIILSGRNGSGKTAATTYLKQKGFASFSLSDELRTLLAEKQLPLDRDTMTREANAYRKAYGHDFLAQRVLKRVGKHAIVESVRHPAEARALQQRDDAVILFLDAPAEQRFQRTLQREEREDPQDFATFLAHDEREWEGNNEQQHVKAVAGMADAVIMNDSTLEKLYKKLDEVLQQHDFK